MPRTEAEPRLASKTIWERFPVLKAIPKNRWPNHVVTIPDGNGRWAKAIQRLALFGHEKGYGVLKSVLKDLQAMPIGIVTIWGFSADNWKRDEQETSGLMSLFERATNEALPELLKINGRFIHLGRKDRIPSSLRETLENAERLTGKNTGQKLVFAIDFGGQDQELRIAQEIAGRQLKKDEVTQELLEQLRDGAGLIPPADLIIRTSGEKRASDLGWLARNAEFYSISRLLPAAKVGDFVDAIVDFSKRDRRFGGRPKK